MTAPARSVSKDTAVGKEAAEEPRVVVATPSRPPHLIAADPPTAGEIGRQVMALRGWRRMLARLAGLPV